MIFIVHRLDDTFFTQFFSETRFEWVGSLLQKKEGKGLGAAGSAVSGAWTPPGDIHGCRGRAKVSWLCGSL
ncbi:hypothetical protein J1605_002780 [Eschrichtius robustus]|uniref:Uncharacterized protein n=1 Tax=Eschrichtius robustus TaxID=9764 RepID=A0AB34HY11_ESCRO|nr:hypothetical protein J1605_002780 [Eschrichtius robustus]